MEYSSIQSTVRVDPVRQAINRANRHLEAGEQAEAIACLEATLAEHPGREDLKTKLQEARNATVTSYHEPAASSGGRTIGLIAAVVAAGLLAYWLLR